MVQGYCFIKSRSEDTEDSYKNVAKQTGKSASTREEIPFHYRPQTGKFVKNNLLECKCIFYHASFLFLGATGWRRGPKQSLNSHV